MEHVVPIPVNSSLQSGDAEGSTGGRCVRLSHTIIQKGGLSYVSPTSVNQEVGQWGNHLNYEDGVDMGKRRNQGNSVQEVHVNDSDRP